jgi:hypothetical protein
MTEKERSTPEEIEKETEKVHDTSNVGRHLGQIQVDRGYAVPLQDDGATATQREKPGQPPVM